MRTTTLVGIVAVTVGLASEGAGLRAAERMTVGVYPAVARAPASIIVTAVVERDDRNRAIELIADSPNFYRSSLVTVEGERAPRIIQIPLKGLPVGEYDIVAVLYGANGERTTDRRTVIVTGLGGER